MNITSHCISPFGPYVDCQNRARGAGPWGNIEGYESKASSEITLQANTEWLFNKKTGNNLNVQLKGYIKKLEKQHEEILYKALKR